MLKTFLESLEDINSLVFIICIFLFLLGFILKILLSGVRYKSELKKKNRFFLLLSNIKSQELAYVNSEQADFLSWCKDNLLFTTLPLISDVETSVENKKAVIELNVRGKLFVTSRKLNELLPPKSIPELSFAPAFLTSLGILGTFVGITHGLTELRFDSADSKDLISGATTLIAGMKVAFITSLCGLGASALFMLFSAKSEGNRAAHYKRVREKLILLVKEDEAIYYLKNLAPENQDKMMEKQEKAMDALTSTSASFGDLVSNLEKSLGSFDPKIMGSVIGDSIKTVMQDEFKPLLAEMTVELAELKHIKAESGKEVIEALTGSLRDEIITPVTKQIEKVSESVDTSSKAISLLSESLGGVVKQLGDFQGETVQKLEEFADKLAATLSTFQLETKGTLEDVGKQIEGSLQVAQDGMRSQREAFVESAHTAKDLMDSAKTNLVDGLGNIDKQIENIKNALQNELEVFRDEYQASLNIYFNKQSESLGEVLYKQENGLLIVIDKFKEAYEGDLAQRSILVKESQSQVSDLLESSKVVRELAEQVSLFKSTQFIDEINATETMGKHIGDLEATYERASIRFESMADTIDKSVKSYFKASTLSTSKFFKEYDEAASKIHNKILGVAGALIDANKMTKSEDDQPILVDKSKNTEHLKEVSHA